MKYGNELAWYHKAFWIIYSITANVTLAIAVFYYGYFYFRENPDKSGVGFVCDLTKHAFATFFLLMETTISGIPVLFTQVIFPLIFTGSYMVFTVIFRCATLADCRLADLQTCRQIGRASCRERV